jgi:cyclase
MMTLAHAFLFVFAITAVAQGTSVPRQDFETVKVAEGIYAFIATESISGVVQGNVTLIVGENSAMLVDSGQYPSLAGRMADKVHELTKKPVRLLLNTHWHGDHLLANHVFQEKFPGLLIVTHEATERLGKKEYENWSQIVKDHPKLIVALRKAVETGKTSKGVILTEEQKRSFAIDADALEAGLADFTETRWTPPELTFQKEIQFDLGKRLVRIMNLGRGNTAGDAVVLIPDAKALVTGDTVVYPTPYSFGSYHSEWIEVLKKMTEMADTYIPGHGPVLRDAYYINSLIALLSDVRTKVQAAVKENLTLEEIRKRVTLSDWKQRFAGDNTDRQRAFDDFFVNPALERAYLEAKGEPLTE